MIPSVNGNKPEWPRPVVAIPMERNVMQDAFYTFMRIAKSGIDFFELPYSMRNDRARDQFTKALLGSNFTHLIMLDSDHTHPADIVERVMNWVIDDPNKRVIGGLNYRRLPPYDPCVSLPDKNGGILNLIELPKGLLKVANEYGPGWIGTGSICISRDVFERIPPPWWRFNYDNYHLDQWPGVDTYFCELCHKHGIDIWIDTTLTSPHLMVNGVDLSTYQSYLKANGVQGKKAKIAIEGLMVDVQS